MKAVYIGLLLFSFLFSLDAEACRCANPSNADALEMADLVVIGKVLEQTTLADGEGTVAIIKVSNSWKEKADGKIAVISLTNCSSKWIAGETYVVFLSHEENGMLSTGLCSGNASRRNANHLIEWLDANWSNYKRIGSTTK